MIGAIEAGGTKFVCAVGEKATDLRDRIVIPTRQPKETMAEVIAYFKKHEPLEAIGIASFGPIEVDKTSDYYGYITTTPKAGWENYDLLSPLKDAFPGTELAFDTDVNGAALGEYTHGAGQDVRSVLYLTVGTGVGGGFVSDGEIRNGYGHPEMGHILVTRRSDDNYKSRCPYHSHCLEGLAAGPTVAGRLGKSSHEIDASHPVFEAIADYLGQALVSYTVTLRPERIVIGGGLMKVPGLLDKVCQAFEKDLNGYLPIPKDYITSPALGDDAGITGAFLLGQEALLKE
ncbi:ROK family protein [Atopobacter sp. AH10]|uniref:ROK family protein n=1 Tax=Atopobacter sp. AH10 TaxID=2315861 RepID=UPI000EF1E836|nr:ROK family protein [Atopobacter sp. AH10]RLK62483.1 ROK family protein [Atopobacter sp. AH10]